MKKNSASRFFGIAAAALAVLFCFVACDKKPIGGGGTILPPDDEDPHVGRSSPLPGCRDPGRYRNT